MQGTKETCIRNAGRLNSSEEEQGDPVEHCGPDLKNQVVTSHMWLSSPANTVLILKTQYKKRL